MDRIASISRPSTGADSPSHLSRRPSTIDSPGRLPPVPGAEEAPEPSTSAPSTPASAPDGASPRPSTVAGELFSNFANGDGLLPLDALSDLLAALGVSESSDSYHRCVVSVAGLNPASLTKDQTMAVIGMMTSGPTLSQPHSRPPSQPPPQLPSQPLSRSPSQPPSQPPSLPHSAASSAPQSRIPSAPHPAAPSAPHSTAPSARHSAAPSASHSAAHSAAPSAAHSFSYAQSQSQALAQAQTQALARGLRNEVSTSSAQSDLNSPARPFRRILTKNRAYMETGLLQVDAAVLQYMAKLEEHRRRCDREGRYQEAKVAARRLADLKTAQIDRLRQELSINQAREVEEVLGVYEEETAKFHAAWDARTREYSASLAQAVGELKAFQQGALAAFVEGLQGRRPTRARPSRDYLAQREVQGKLAKAQLYGRATEVKVMADELYQAELETTLAAWEAESKLKIAKLQTKQQTEYEALQQRGAKGRDELDLKRISETERRALRFRNIISELEQLHKLELAHLENFLDGQVLAGKATPLRDPAAFRRKREQLFSIALA